MPIDEINRIMTNNSQWQMDGMGESGKSYLVGADFKVAKFKSFFVAKIRLIILRN